MTDLPPLHPVPPTGPDAWRGVREVIPAAVHLGRTAVLPHLLERRKGTAP